MFSLGFSIKDLRTGRILMEGPVRENLYLIPVREFLAVLQQSRNNNVCLNNKELKSKE